MEQTTKRMRLSKVTAKDLRCIANTGKQTFSMGVPSAKRPEKAAIPIFGKTHGNGSGDAVPSFMPPVPER